MSRTLPIRSQVPRLKRASATLYSLSSIKASALSFFIRWWSQKLARVMNQLSFSALPESAWQVHQSRVYQRWRKSSWPVLCPQCHLWHRLGSSLPSAESHKNQLWAIIALRVRFLMLNLPSWWQEWYLSIFPVFSTLSSIIVLPIPQSMLAPWITEGAHGCLSHLRERFVSKLGLKLGFWLMFGHFWRW